MRLLLHIIFWILIWLWMTSVYVYDFVDFVPFLLYNLERLPVIIAATYAVNYFVVNRYMILIPPDYTKAGIFFITIFLIATLIDRVISGLDWLVPTLNGEPLYYKFFNPIAIPKNAFLLLGILGLAAAIGFLRVTLLHQRQIFQLKEEKLQTELALLRSQVNPHFLFNAFNNLYSLAIQAEAKELAKGLSGMAGLMRYLTYESQVPKVLLEKEINLIHSFIEIQKLRVSDGRDLFINFKIEGSPSNIFIAPVLLLPLVENAFKHGTVPGKESWINIQLSIENSAFTFDIRNKKPDSLYKNEKGVGLANLRKRLELIYSGHYELRVDETNEIFTCILKIDLT